MIKAEGLTKHYGALKAVDGISFKVEPGEVLGFLGPNGAGKSTTMRMFAGFVLVLRGDPVFEFNADDISAARQSLGKHVGFEAGRKDEAAARADNAIGGHLVLPKLLGVVSHSGSSITLLPGRHSGKGRNPVALRQTEHLRSGIWVPAFAGMTAWESVCKKQLHHPSGRSRFIFA